MSTVWFLDTRAPCCPHPRLREGIWVVSVYLCEQLHFFSLLFLLLPLGTFLLFPPAACSLGEPPGWFFQLDQKRGQRHVNPWGSEERFQSVPLSRPVRTRQGLKCPGNLGLDASPPVSSGVSTYQGRGLSLGQCPPLCRHLVTCPHQ